ncbi:Uncharacterised protein [Mycobacterium tuberculosis]|nr:Uncharacterised protein [Mycobacterium tuberculosis]
MDSTCARYGKLRMDPHRFLRKSVEREQPERYLRRRCTLSPAQPSFHTLRGSCWLPLPACATDPRLPRCAALSAQESSLYLPVSPVVRKLVRIFRQWKRRYPLLLREGSQSIGFLASDGQRQPFHRQTENACQANATSRFGVEAGFQNNEGCCTRKILLLLRSSAEIPAIWDSCSDRLLHAGS